jgi:hypothetical protein
MTYLGVHGHVPIQHHAYTEDRLLGGRVGPEGLFFCVRGADIDFTHRLFGGPRKKNYLYEPNVILLVHIRRDASITYICTVHWPRCSRAAMKIRRG